MDPKDLNFLNVKRIGDFWVIVFELLAILVSHWR